MAIAAVGFSDTTRYFDANGKLVPIPAYQKFELGSYVEYGASDRVTVILQPSADIVHQSGQPASPAAAETAFGARVGLLNIGTTVVSAQAIANIPFTSTSTQTAIFDESRAPAVDVRLMLGHSFVVADMPAFLDIEASHTWLGEGLPDEWHGDATVGLRPRPQLAFLLSSLTTVAGGSTACCVPWRWVKLQSSVVYDFSRQWSAQAGFFATVIGQNIGREMGPMLALWYRF